MATQKQVDLKNQLQQQAQQQPAKVDINSLSPKQKVSYYMEQMKPTIEAVLPKEIDPERMTRIAMNVIRTNPKLLECDINSLMGGVLEAAKLGLEPGIMGQAYLIPYGKDAQFIIGYKGLIDLVRRSGQVSTIEARTVFENDEFDYAYGLDSYLKHKPTLKDKGEAIAYYAVCKLKDGGSSFLVMSKQEIEQYRDQYSKSKKFGPWVNEFDAMARKTCLRQLIKYLPISVEKLSSYDERNGSEIHKDLANTQLIDDGFIPITIDGETGEVIEGEEQ